jgi:hypothetical protein
MKTSRLAPLLFLVASAASCVGLEAGSRYPNYSSSKVRQDLLSPENQEDPSLSLGAFKVRDEACEGIDTHTRTQPLAQDDLLRFLEAQKVGVKQIKARGNLYWFDFPGTDPEDGDVVRLRVAVLDNAEDAAAELHAALLQHGPGWWGLRRSNLSVLAPKAGVAEAMAFVLRNKLACWGTVSMAHADDVYTVPGPYMEL